MLNIFSTRELSIGIWLIMVTIWMLLYKPIRKSLIDLIKNACSIQLSLPFFFMIAYSLGITYVFYRTSFWKNIFIKNIILWVMFVGTPLFFSAINKSSEDYYFKKVVLSNFKLTVLMKFFVSSFTFSLITEIILVPVFSFIFMLDAIAATKSEYKPAKKLMSFLIIIITIFFLYETVIAAVKRPGSLYTTDTLISLLIPIIFSVLYIPISFFFAVVCRYQIIFMRMGFKEPKDDTTLKIKHRFKTIWNCKFSLSNLSVFEKSYIKHMYVGMSTDEFDKLIQQFKLQISNKLLDNQDSKEEKILYNQLKEKYFLNKIGYINKHAGIFTLLFTSVIGLTSILLKGFYYVFIRGKLDYWGVSHTYINISNENMLYEVLLFAAYSIIYISLNYIPFSIITSKKAWYKKMLRVIILITITAGFLTVYFLLNERTVNSDFALNLELIVSSTTKSLILTLFIYLLGLLMPISFMTKKKKNTYEEGVLLHKLISFSTLFILMLGISLYIIYFYCYGRSLASNQKSFKTIDNNHVVIYESRDDFIISDYDVENNTLIVDTMVQTLIKKENIKTEIKSFEKVERKHDK